MSEAEKFDLMVFGASGFTGQYLVEMLAKTAKDEGVSWAVAGRYESKIKQVLDFASTETGINLDHIKIFKADSSDYDSIIAMAKVSKIVLNCVGPYRWFGEPVVRACLEVGAHHLDISGEPNFLERIQLLYHDLAKEKKVYIIGACGFDSIPCEIGSLFLEKKFGENAEMNSIEQFIEMTSTHNEGSGANHGTWDSAVHSFSIREELADTRKKLKEKFYTKPSIPVKHKLQSRGLVSKNNKTGKWSLIFPSADASIFYRTQKELYQENNRRPCQFKAYIELPSIIHSFVLLLVGIMINFLAPFKLTRNLLHKYPSLFSFGIFKKGGPTREHVLNSGFNMRLVGQGWSEKLADPSDQHSTRPDKKLSVLVKGPNAGYIATPIAMIQSALMVLKHKDQLPNEGGVYTPGVAFRNTNLIEELNKNRITMHVEE